MPYECYVLTTWIQDASGNHPALNALLGPGDSWEDCTGQPVESIMPDPNAYVVHMPTCSDATLAAIEADADHVVLSAEEVVADAI